MHSLRIISREELDIFYRVWRKTRSIDREFSLGHRISPVIKCFYAEARDCLRQYRVTPALAEKLDVPCRVLGDVSSVLKDGSVRAGSRQGETVDFALEVRTTGVARCRCSAICYGWSVVRWALDGDLATATAQSIDTCEREQDLREGAYRFVCGVCSSTSHDSLLECSGWTCNYRDSATWLAAVPLERHSKGHNNRTVWVL